MTNLKLSFKFTISTFLLFTVFTNCAYAQILNDDINIEVGVKAVMLETAFDASGPLVEPNVRIDIAIDGNIELEGCIAWATTETPPLFFELPSINTFGVSTAHPNNAAVTFPNLFAHEDDDNIDCEFNAAEDDLKFDGVPAFSSASTITFGDRPGEWDEAVLSLPQGVPAGNPVQGWINNLNGGDMIPMILWRYAAGNIIDNPLQFGEIAIGESRTHRNANYGPAEGVDPTANLSNYSDNGGLPGNSSPNVFYSFEITESAVVTITTDYSVTNFNTDIGLYDANENLLENTILSTNEIVRTLCPGTYSVLVEGNQNEEGRFQLGISASALSVNFSVGLFSTSVNCAGDLTGNASAIAIGGGVEPYTLQWSNGEVTETINNVAGGTYSLTVTDACGDQITESVEVEINDNQAPSTSCTSLNVVVIEGQDYTLSQSEIDGLVNASDNCGVESIDAGQTVFTDLDAGSNSVTVTVADGAGNTSMCQATVEVSVQTSVEDIAYQSLLIHPNPTNAIVQVNVAGLDINEFKLIDCTGKVMQTEQVSPNTSLLRADLSSYAEGVYLLIASGNKVQYRSSIVKSN